MAQNDMAGSLMVHLVAHLLKSADGLLAGANGQAAHAGISTISSLMGGGVGSPCFLRLARYPVIASLMLARASARVLPCEMQPGSAGHSATNTPSSSGSMTTRYFILLICERPIEKSTAASGVAGWWPSAKTFWLCLVVTILGGVPL